MWYNVYVDYYKQLFDIYNVDFYFFIWYSASTNTQGDVAMNQYNFGSKKAIKYFLKCYSNLIELKQRGNQDAVEVLTDFELILKKINNPKIINQYIDIESGNMEVCDKVKYFGKNPLEIISSKSRMSLDKVKEMFDLELEKIVKINGKEDFEMEMPIYIYKDKKKESKEEIEYSEYLQKLKEEEKKLREKIEEEEDSKNKKNLINMKKDLTKMISDEYEKEGIGYKKRESKSIKKNQVMYDNYIDNVPEDLSFNGIAVVEQIDSIAKAVLDLDEYKIFTLYYAINYTQEEISEILGVKQQTISYQIKKINKKIKKSCNNQKCKKASK